MRDLTTMLWKESREVLAHRRSLTLFLLGVLAFGILPAISFRSHGGHALGGGTFLLMFRMAYGLFAAVFVGLQTAPDLVLHERVGHTLDYLLTTRLPDSAIYGGKVLTAAIMSYLAGWLALFVQLAGQALLGGHGWQWLYLGLPEGRTAAFFIMAGLSVYVSVLGTFVAFRVGEQRAAYMVSLLGVGVLLIPLLLGWVPFAFTTTWVNRAAGIFDVFTVLVGAVGLLLFRRQMLVLYLQE